MTHGLRNNFAILATLKIFDWHCNWHWQKWKVFKIWTTAELLVYLSFIKLNHVPDGIKSWRFTMMMMMMMMTDEDDDDNDHMYQSNLFFGNAHAAVDVGKDCRLNEVTLVSNTLSTTHQLCSLRLARLYQLQNLVHLNVIDLVTVAQYISHRCTWLATTEDFSSSRRRINAENFHNSIVQSRMYWQSLSEWLVS